jgi:hypothetical protein
MHLCIINWKTLLPQLCILPPLFISQLSFLDVCFSTAQYPNIRFLCLDDTTTDWKGSNHETFLESNGGMQDELDNYDV